MTEQSCIGKSVLTSKENTTRLRCTMTTRTSVYVRAYVCFNTLGEGVMSTTYVEYETTTLKRKSIQNSNECWTWKNLEKPENARVYKTRPIVLRVSEIWSFRKIAKLKLSERKISKIIYVPSLRQECRGKDIMKDRMYISKGHTL